MRARTLSPLLLALTLSSGVALVYASPSLARACRCAPKSTADALAGADAVFAGAVKRARRSGGGRVYDVEVAGWWKGEPGREVVVFSPSSSCGVTLWRGDTWTYYAEREGERYRINLCSGPGGGERQPLEELAKYTSYDGSNLPPGTAPPAEEVPPEEEPAKEPPKQEPPKQAPAEEEKAAPVEPPASGASGCRVNPSAPAAPLAGLAGLGLLLLVRRRA